MRRVKLTSDGTVHGTKLTNEDGREIPGIIRIEIDPIDARTPNHLIPIRVMMYADVQLDAQIASIDVKEILTHKGETYGKVRNSKPSSTRASCRDDSNFNSRCNEPLLKPSHGFATRYPGEFGGGGGTSYVGKPCRAVLPPDDADGSASGSDDDGHPSGGGQGRVR